MKSLALALLFLMLGLGCLGADDIDFGAPSTVPTAPPITDPAQVGQHYREVITRAQFHEQAEPPVNARIEDWLSQWFRSLGAKFGEFKYASRMPAFESMLMTLLVVFAIAVLFYIMVRLTRRRARMGAEGEEETAGPKAFRPPEAYDEEIHHAIRAGDWHAAWLASWRQFLSRLEHRNLVEADRTRTNREYLAQLRGRILPASALGLVTGLVDAYDRVIYGHQVIAEVDWSHFREQIDEAARLLNLEEKARAAPGGGVAP